MAARILLKDKLTLRVLEAFCLSGFKSVSLSWRLPDIQLTASVVLWL